MQVYRNYEHRNDYAHGSDMPEISFARQHDFMKATSRVMRVALTERLPPLDSLEARVIPWIERDIDKEDG